jgi:hypothetical protein
MVMHFIKKVGRREILIYKVGKRRERIKNNEITFEKNE